MRKIRLDVDAVSVESFATEKAAVPQGTVRGHDDVTELCPAPSEYFTCKWGRTEYDTCIVQCECTNRQIRCKGL